MMCCSVFVLLYLCGGVTQFLGLIADARLVGNDDVTALAEELIALRLRAEFAAAVTATVAFVAVWPVIFIYGQYRQHISRAF